MNLEFRFPDDTVDPDDLDSGEAAWRSDEAPQEDGSSELKNRGRITHQTSGKTYYAYKIFNTFGLYVFRAKGTRVDYAAYDAFAESVGGAAFSMRYPENGSWKTVCFDGDGPEEFQPLAGDRVAWTIRLRGA